MIESSKKKATRKIKSVAKELGEPLHIFEPETFLQKFVSLF
jgi:hypothetical protein